MTQRDQSITRRERVTQCGPHDAYFLEVPVVMTGSQIHALADEVALPRPIWPPQVLHAVLMRSAFAAELVHDA